MPRLLLVRRRRRQALPERVHRSQSRRPQAPGREHQTVRLQLVPAPELTSRTNLRRLLELEPPEPAPQTIHPSPVPALLEPGHQTILLLRELALLSKLMTHQLNLRRQHK